MKKIINAKKEEWEQVLSRPISNYFELEEKVNQVFDEVHKKGDRAVEKYTKLFDSVTLERKEVTFGEIELAIDQMPKNLIKAIELAKSNIEKFHAAQKTKKVEIETSPGVHCWQEKRPIQKIGLYIPGGSAPLFSTILMLALPAKLAGCRKIILCTPPNKEGKIHPAIIYTAALCGIFDIYKVGGIQAIAAMTYGTETIPKVHKIFGPGNQFVTAAKQFATKYNVAIDMPAGPSELMVVADDSANPAFVASDLLSQAEHGTDSQVLLLTSSKKLLYEVEKEVETQLKNLPRKDIAKASLKNSKLIFIEDEEVMLEMINEYAPEHLIICMEKEDFFVDGIQNAGSVFIGNYTPESAGDYASGTNHTLPTNGYAKQYSGVNLDSFLKAVTFQKITEKGLRNIGNAIETMAEAEGLLAHKNAVSIRLKAKQTNNTTDEVGI